MGGKNVLYLTYDGLTDSLGQSQILPYIIGLRKKGFCFTIISFEKWDKLIKNGDSIKDIVVENDIIWFPLTFTSYPPVFSKIYDLWRFKKKAIQICKSRNFNFIHCRSYVSAQIGLYLKRKLGLKFIFDMRGFWVDERIDGKIWNKNNPLYYLMYKWYKGKEKTLLKNADSIISLTFAAKKYLTNNFELNSEITVIPCAVDLELFKPCNSQIRKIYRKKLNLRDNDYIIVYLGSIGTWYMLEEMLDFYNVVSSIKPEAKFHFLTTNNPDLIISKAQERNITLDKIIINSAKRNEIPKYLAAADVSIFFIKPYFSKMASSPTKHGELLGCNIPVICNQGIGDLDEIIENSNTGVIVKGFTKGDYYEAFNEIIKFEHSSHNFNSTANSYYSIQKAIELLDDTYCDMLL